MTEPEEQFSDDVMRSLLASIDHPVPPLRANVVIKQARIRSGRRTALLVAAAVILTASVATAAVPGSYLRNYLQRLLGERASAPMSHAPTNGGAADASARGIAFAPGAQVDVDFRAEQTSGTLQIRWADVSLVSLSQTGSHGDAHYGLTPGGVLVENGGSTSSYALVLPRTLARARVRVVGREVFTRVADSVSCAGMRVEIGSCVIDIAAEQRSKERHGAP